ncbi:MAG: hypothetical protein Q8M11_17400 [Sulfuritalea sp.]|nr:hypothetical protein [Sulfuritalea sp.]MDP1983544.1 hypothetical protein [Sulfuritalea sp.]
MHDFQFDRSYSPEEFIEGKPNSLVWIVGLNPKNGGEGPDNRSLADLEDHFCNLDTVHPYFRDFRIVSESMYNGFGKNCGTAHTDIVKCASKSFPGGRIRAVLIENCKPYLEVQLRRHKPKVIVCNGADVSKFMLAFIPPQQSLAAFETSYWATFGGAPVCVVLSGFIGRIDNYAKRRLGAEIERRVCEIGTQT